MSLSPKEKKFCQEYICSLHAFEASAKTECELKSNGAGFYVYFLVNTKSGQIVYIGKGKGDRMHDHEKEFRSGKMANAHKFKKYEETFLYGGKIQPLVFVDDLDDTRAYAIERELIITLRDHGISNIQNGIVTNEERDRVHAKQLLSRVMPFEKWVGVRQRTDKEVEMYHNIIVNLKTVSEGRWTNIITSTTRA